MEAAAAAAAADAEAGVMMTATLVAERPTVTGPAAPAAPAAVAVAAETGMAGGRAELADRPMAAVLDVPGARAGGEGEGKENAAAPEAPARVSINVVTGDAVVDLDYGSEKAPLSTPTAATTSGGVGSLGKQTSGIPIRRGRARGGTAAGGRGASAKPLSDISDAN